MAAATVFFARVHGNTNHGCGVEFIAIQAFTNVGVRARADTFLVASAATIKVEAAVDLGTILSVADVTLIALA